MAAGRAWSRVEHDRVIAAVAAAARMREPVVRDAGGAERSRERVDLSVTFRAVDSATMPGSFVIASDDSSHGTETRAQRLPSIVETGGVVTEAAKLIAPAAKTFAPAGVS